MRPQDYFEDALNSDQSLQTVEIEASFTKDQSNELWTYTWDLNLFHEDEHESHSDYNSHMTKLRVTESLVIYLEELRNTFFVNTNKKVRVEFRKARPMQDIWRCEFSIVHESIVVAMWRWIKEIWA